MLKTYSKAWTPTSTRNFLDIAFKARHASRRSSRRVACVIRSTSRSIVSADEGPWEPWSDPRTLAKPERKSSILSSLETASHFFKHYQDISSFILVICTNMKPATYSIEKYVALCSVFVSFQCIQKQLYLFLLPMCGGCPEWLFIAQKIDHSYYKSGGFFNKLLTI